MITVQEGTCYLAGTDDETHHQSVADAMREIGGPDAEDQVMRVGGTCTVVRCDGCDEYFDYEGNLAIEHIAGDRDAVIAHISESGWRVLSDGRVSCSKECWQENWAHPEAVAP